MIDDQNVAAQICFLLSILFGYVWAQLTILAANDKNDDDPDQ